MSSVKVIVITRFGIGVTKKDWYDYRYVVHKTFGQSCILNQTNQDFEWLICLDSNPPKDFYSKLSNDVKEYKNVHLLHIESNFVNEYRKYIEKNLLENSTEKVIFVRHDDDDAIPTDFVQKIHDQLIKENELLYYIEESDETMHRIQQLRDNCHWGRLIQNYFQPKICDSIFFGKNAKNNVKIYYKNKYVATVGKTLLFGPVDAQLKNLEKIIEKESAACFVPFVSIHSYSKGYVYNKDGNHTLYKINLECNAQAIYSILPVKAKKISYFRDCMYEAGESHINLHRLKGIAYYCHDSVPENYLIVRSFINDSHGGDSYNKYIPQFYPLVFSERLFELFSISRQQYQIFLRTMTFSSFEKKQVHALPTGKERKVVEIDESKLKEEYHPIEIHLKKKI
jgi:hypothetical protein